MNIKTQLIAFGVRLVADNTTLIRKPNGIEGFISELFGEETYDVQIARNLEENAARATNAIKRTITDRKFKKIIEHV